MKIIVLGAGVIGVSTAYVLGKAGHDVMVIDKASEICTQTSHANGGQLAFSYADPFASPATLRNLAKYLFGNDPGISMHWSKDPFYYSWGLQFLKQCTQKNTTANLQQLLDLASKSQQAMIEVAAHLPDGIINKRPRGKLILTRSDSESHDFGKSMPLKQKFGVPIELVDKARCFDIEPALEHWQNNFSGGVWAKNDDVLDTLEFCRALQTISIEKFSVEYRFEHEISGLNIDRNCVVGMLTNKAELDCGAAVICLGNEANALLRSIGDAKFIYPMQGYSLTLPLGIAPPQVSITDPKHKIVFSKLGNKMRIAGLMDANLSAHLVEKRQHYLFDLARRLFPNAADFQADPVFWSGMRPMTPSSIPIIQPGKYKGLFYNIGHGSMGLTFCMGSAIKIANLIRQESTN